MRFPTIYFRFTGIRWPTSTRPGKLAQEARPPHCSAGELFCLIGFSRPVARAVGCVAAMEACAARWLFETLVAHLYGLRTVGRQGVSPGGGEAILGCGLSYLLALQRVRLLRPATSTYLGMVARVLGYGRYRANVNLPPDVWLPPDLAGVGTTNTPRSRVRSPVVCGNPSPP